MAGEDLGTVYRYGRRHWQAQRPDGHTAIHRADSRTEAINAYLGTPGPLWGDPRRPDPARPDHLTPRTTAGPRGAPSHPGGRAMQQGVGPR